MFFFFFQAEDGIRDYKVTGVQTCALPIFPCRGGVPPLKGDKLTEIYAELADPGQWKIVNEHHLVRTYKFPDFKSALAFVNRVGEVAEEQRSEERRVGK